MVAVSSPEPISTSVPLRVITCLSKLRLRRIAVTVGDGARIVSKIFEFFDFRTGTLF
jgi:hypothetical protein